MGCTPHGMTTVGGGGAGGGAGGGGGGSKNTHLVSVLVLRVVRLTIVFLTDMCSHSIYFNKKYFNFLSATSDKKKFKN